MVFSSYSNPVWNVDEDYYCTSNNDELEPKGEDDPHCPTIHLTKERKHYFRQPWKNALIIKMFQKGVGFLRLQRSLTAKWKLKGDFSLIDIGCDYYVTRFTNLDDNRHVLTRGP